MRDPWPADEPRFAEVAREMVATGDWLFPRVGGELYADKPPLFFWMIAGLLVLTHSLRLSFLLPSLLASIGVLWLSFDLARRWWNRRVGLAAAIILVTTIQFSIQAHRGQIDMVICFFVTLGLYGLLRHLKDGPRWGWYSVGCAAMGAGVITKGVGFLPLLAFLPWTLALRKRWSGATTSKSLLWFVGPLALGGVIALWLTPVLVAVAASGDPGFEAYRNEILFTQTAGRYADPWHHLRPFWYYLVNVIPVLWLPLSIALPALTRRWWNAMRARDLRILLLLGWAFLTLLFFSISPAKRGVYILVVLPAIAIASAPWAAEIWDRRSTQTVGFLITVMLTLTLVGALAVVEWNPTAEFSTAATELGVDLRQPLLVMAMVGGLLLALFRRRGLAALIAFSMMCSVLFSLWVAPAINGDRSGRKLVAVLERHLEPGSELGLVAWKEQFLLYLDRPATHFGHRRRDHTGEISDAVAWLRQQPNRVLLIDQPTFEECFAKGDLIIRAHGTTWYLVGADDLTDACTARREPVITVRFAPPERHQG